MIDVSGSSRNSVKSLNEIALQQLQDRIALRTCGLNDTNSEPHHKATLQNQYKQFKEHYKMTADNKDTIELDHSNANETTEHKLYDLRRQTSELQAQSRNVGLIPKVYPPRMTSSNSTPVSNRISSICSPTDNFPLPTSCAIPARPSSPQRRRIKSPPPDDIHTDIDFATEIGQGLLLEVRKMHSLLQERNETIKVLEIAKVNAEISMWNLEKKLKAKEDVEERLKDQFWDLELSNQELIAQVTQLQQSLARKTVDHNRVSNKLNALAEESEMLRNQNEQQSEVVKSLQKKITEPSSPKQNRTSQRHPPGYSSRSSLLPIPAKLESTRSVSIASITTSVADSDTSDTPKQTKESNVSLSSSATDAKGMESDALKHSLSQAHRTIAQLRAWLHMERMDKIERKKLLSESQETIAKLRRKKNIWHEEEPTSQMNTLKIKMVPSKRRGAARYARGLISSSEADHECELELCQAEEEIQICTLVEIDNTISQQEEKFSDPMETSNDSFPAPRKVRSFGEELRQASTSPDTSTIENLAEDRVKKANNESVQPPSSPHRSEPVQMKSQVAYHAKRASPKRRNVDSNKECSIRRSPKVRDLSDNPSMATMATFGGKTQDMPSPKPTLSDTNVKVSAHSTVVRPSRSEPRVPFLSQTLLPPTSNLEELKVQRGNENRMSLGSNYGLGDMIARLEVYDSNSQPRSPRSIRKSTDSQYNRSSIIGHWRSSSTGDIIPSKIEDSTGGLSLLTQTMIGEWMWKYTRKSVGNGYSEKPHKRFCWIHPYTRTLYWSTVEPGIGEAESRVKSAFIESVAIAEDPDMSSRDMLKVSLIIKTSTRELKLKAGDDIRHSMWFEALKYLLLRTSPAPMFDLPVLGNSNTKRRSEVLSSTISQATLLCKTSNARISTSSTDKYQSEQPSSEHNPSTFSALSTLFHRSPPVAVEGASAPPTTAQPPPKQHNTLSHRMSMRLRPLSTVSTSLSLRRRQSLASHIALSQ